MFYLTGDSFIHGLRNLVRHSQNELVHPARSVGGERLLQDCAQTYGTYSNVTKVAIMNNRRNLRIFFTDLCICVSVTNARWCWEEVSVQNEMRPFQNWPELLDSDHVGSHYNDPGTNLLLERNKYKFRVAIPALIVIQIWKSAPCPRELVKTRRS